MSACMRLLAWLASRLASRLPELTGRFDGLAREIAGFDGG